MDQRLDLCHPQEIDQKSDHFHVLAVKVACRRWPTMVEESEMVN